MKKNNELLLIKRLITLFIACQSFVCVCSQNSWTEWSEMIDDDDDLSSWQTMYEELSELAENPININTVTKEQLEALPFLSDIIIENILYYLYKYGPMLTKNELLGVEGMDWKTRKLLSEFIYIGKADDPKNNLKLKNILKYGKQEITARLDIPFQQKAGYADYDEETLAKSPNKKYYGDPLYTNLRYRFNYRQQLFFGLTAEKDPGEPMFSKYNKKGYDSYSAYFFIENYKKIKSLALGHYKASFGYGLVINTGNFFLNSTNDPYSMNRMGNGLKKYTSTDESDMLQGAGLTYKIAPRWSASLFVSHKQIDALVDSLLIKSFKTDGYHRLYKDLQKKNTATNSLIGSNINYNGKYFEMGITAVYNFLNKELNPDLKPYNVYYPRGKYFFNTGINYKIYLKRLIFSGETAVDKNGRLSTINFLIYSPSVNTSFFLVNRFYDKQYQSLTADSYCQNSYVQNEQGIYIGLKTKPLYEMNLSCFADLFRFPYRKYGVDANGTYGLSAMVNLSYSPSNSLYMLIKYTCKNRAKNFTDADGNDMVIPYIRQRLSYQLSYSPREQTGVKIVIDGNRCSFYRQQPSYGWSVSANVKYKFSRTPLRVSLYGAYFHTDDYNSRVYLYEPGILYSFSMSSFYGQGVRISAVTSMDLTRRITLQMKFGWTHYYDRDTIGQDAEEIQGNDKSNLSLQLRMKI